MIRFLTHCGGNFRKTAALLSKYVVKSFGEYGRHSKGLTMENSLEGNLHPQGLHVSLGSQRPKFVLCSWCFLCASANELVNHPLLHCIFSKQIWTMFPSIFGVRWVVLECIKLALSSWYEQLHRETITTTQLLFLPAFYGLFGGGGTVDVSVREARIDAREYHLDLDPSVHSTLSHSSSLANLTIVTLIMI